MANVKVEVLDAVVNGKVKGEQLSVSEKAAEKLEKNGYVKVLEEAKDDSPEDEFRKLSAQEQKDKVEELGGDLNELTNEDKRTEFYLNNQE